MPRPIRRLALVALAPGIHAPMFAMRPDSTERLILAAAADTLAPRENRR